MQTTEIMDPVSPAAGKQTMLKADSKIRGQIKLELLTIGYDLAGKSLGFATFSELVKYAGNFPRAVELLKTFMAGDTHETTIRMLEALTLPKFSKRFQRQYKGRRVHTKGIILEHYNLRKLVRKWGGVYRRVWKVNKRIEKKEGGKIKEEKSVD